METVKVLKPLKKNNMFDGFREIEVSKELAEKQLALPDEKRNPAWRGVKLKEEEKEKKTRKPKDDISLESAPVSTDTAGA